MTGTIRAELLKLFSIRTTWALIAASAAMGLLVLAGLPPPQEHATGAALLLELFVAASITSPLVLALGTLLVGGEFHHKTISQTLLVTPNRGRLLVAKLLVGAAGGLALSTACLLVALSVGLPALAGRGVTIGMLDQRAVLGLVGSLAANALWAMLGVGLGAVLRSQVAAIVAALVFNFAVDPVLQGIAPRLWRYLPAAADQGLTKRPFSFAAITSMPPLGRVASLGVFLAWAGAATLAAELLLRQRDVT